MKNTLKPIIIALLAGRVLAGLSGALKEGDPAPDFALPDQDGVIHSLSDYRGKNLVIYFYPKDDTPGCTREACGFRDQYEDFTAQSVVILGISYDSPESHQAFKDKYNLPFDLLSDAKKSAAKAYGAAGYFPYASRKTFLVNEEGIIVKIFPDVDITTHSQDILNFFRDNIP